MRYNGRGKTMGGMHQTPSGERVHIAFFGRRNVGKSSLMNAFTGQDLSVVSEMPGTTTDAVYKAMELLPLGPVALIAYLNGILERAMRVFDLSKQKNKEKSERSDT